MKLPQFQNQISPTIKRRKHYLQELRRNACLHPKIVAHFSISKEIRLHYFFTRLLVFVSHWHSGLQSARGENTKLATPSLPASSKAACERASAWGAETNSRIDMQGLHPLAAPYAEISYICDAIPSAFNNNNTRSAAE